MSDWIDWQGGECPVAADAEVAAMISFPTWEEERIYRADDLLWNKHETPDGFIFRAYRLVVPPPTFADLAAKDAEIARLTRECAYWRYLPRDEELRLSVAIATETIARQDAENDRLRAELAQAREALTKAGIEFGTKHGCHCDLEEGAEPDDCVFEHNAVSDCRLAMDLQRRGKGRDDCHEWRPVVIVRAAIKGES